MDVTRTVHSSLVYAALQPCKAALAARMRIRRVTSVTHWWYASVRYRFARTALNALR